MWIMPKNSENRRSMVLSRVSCPRSTRQRMSDVSDNHFSDTTCLVGPVRAGQRPGTHDRVVEVQYG